MSPFHCSGDSVSPARVVVDDPVEAVPEEHLGLAHPVRRQAQLEHLELHVGGVEVVLHLLVQLELSQESVVGVDALALGLHLLQGFLQSVPGKSSMMKKVYIFCADLIFKRSTTRIAVAEARIDKRIQQNNR